MGRRRNSQRPLQNRDPRHRGPAVSKIGDGSGSQRGTARVHARSRLPQPETGSRYPLLAVCGFLLLAVALVFAQTVRFDFVNFDDDQYVYENPQVQSGLTTEAVTWALTHSHASNWHPLTWFSHMLDCQLYGLHPWGHHLTNVLLQAAAAVLLFMVLRALTGRLWPSALAAALFAIHPLRAESVAWVTERKDVLSGMLFFLAIAAYASYVRRPGSIGRYALVLLALALGLMAKPMLVTLPLVLLLLDYWPLRRWAAEPAAFQPGSGNGAAMPKSEPTTAAGWRRAAWLVVEKTPLFVLSAACCVVTVLAQGQSIGRLEVLPLPWRLANAVTTYVAYLGQFFYPAGLLPIYRHPLQTIPIAEVVGASLLLAILTAGAVLARRKFPYLIVGWFWYLGMLVPVIGLVQVGKQAMADRYTYLPQVGIALIIAWAMADLWTRWRGGRATCAVAASLALALSMGLAWRQTSYWRDSTTLWSYTLAHGPSGAVAYNNFGNTLCLAGKIAEAGPYYQKALEVDPAYVQAYNNLGNVQYHAGDVDQAIRLYRKALEIDPHYVQSHNNLSMLLYQKGDLEEAAAHCRTTLQLNPRSPDALAILGEVADRKGDVKAAIALWRRRLQLQPNHVETLGRLAWALATHPDASIRNGAEAVELAGRGVRLSGAQDSAALDALAAAYAEAGRFPEARAALGKALELATQRQDRALADVLRSRLVRYESDQPYRQTLPGSAISR
jgi:tetratricopeptide (TPR) repeat protein